MVGLEQVKELLRLIEAFLFRYRGPLSGKAAIMAYTGMKDVALDDALRGGLPAFKLGVGSKLYSHTDAIDFWLIEMAKRRVNISHEADLKEGEQ